MVRLALAVAAAAAIILSAPVVQQAFTALSRDLPLDWACRDGGADCRRGPGRGRAHPPPAPLRFAALALSLATGGAYVVLDALTPTESFHFVEYGAARVS